MLPRPTASAPRTIAPAGPKGTRAAILELLKRNGPMAAEALAARLGVTAMAVRQHLHALEDRGLADHQAERRGVGRPVKLWSAAAAADAHFPDAHGALAVELLEQMRRAFGAEGLDRILALRAAAQERSYRARMAGKRTLGARLGALARARSEEGYMAEVRKDGEGFLFIENHCPVCAAAKVCQGLCRDELAVFRRVLGPEFEIARTEHILAGARRCAYRVTGKSARRIAAPRSRPERTAR